ncbi:hypothetical protein KXD93_07310 [Mucilaginibacter sp. BJC16-A38]|uniref:hypothetical protein n=1 Tax=Mucilaginibacter phenanthrenivorans TaxID=1234842 RepID=UPI0021584538|nr:hypothetical protein [Mucilaginibacter phenanthrenivorans]MCR8557442.1 hypothetical protein [Mucilaginibacter phenanthrenivorans]
MVRVTTDLQKKNVALLIPFITFLGFIAISINSLFCGIDHHETWRMVLAAVGGLFFVAFAALTAFHLVKNNKTIKA